MTYPLFSDEYFMLEAIKEARKAFEKNEVPVGAVIVLNNQIIGRGFNMAEELQDVTAHAEMIAITSAENYLGAKYLMEATLYVTLEPCVMCAAATRWAQLGKLVYGAGDPKFGFNIYEGPVIHPRTEIKPGVLENKCGILLKEFFKNKRK
jgi:tRNA(adenine34) deaminase